MENVVNVFLEELRDMEILHDGKLTGVVQLEDAEYLMKLLALAIKNECNCEEVEDMVDRSKTYNRLREMA